jgi:hypothetical protein
MPYHCYCLTYENGTLRDDDDDEDQPFASAAGTSYVRFLNFGLPGTLASILQQFNDLLSSLHFAPPPL